MVSPWRVVWKDVGEISHERGGLEGSGVKIYGDG